MFSTYFHIVGHKNCVQIQTEVEKKVKTEIKPVWKKKKKSPSQCEIKVEAGRVDAQTPLFKKKGEGKEEEGEGRGEGKGEEEEGEGSDTLQVILRNH